MNKLKANTYFSNASSTISTNRSKFNLSHKHLMTMNAGKLYPFYIEEVVPGDTFVNKTGFVNRVLAPLRTPVMDNSFMDYWYFFVPMRLVWDHTKEFFGDNRDSAWVSSQEYYIPHLDIEFKQDGVGDHFGVPTKTRISGGVDALPFRAYRLIWNEWFRDQNTQDPVLINYSDTEDRVEYDDLLPLNKRKDYFTTALPSPQKGPATLLPLGSFAPVVTRDAVHNNGGGINSIYWSGSSLGEDQQVQYLLTRNTASVARGQVYTGDNEALSAAGLKSPYPVNLWTDLSNASGATINDLRQAFAVQHIFELDARCGSRYREHIKAYFGVDVPDLTVSVPEYLGGDSVNLNVDQVVQTSASVDGSDQGNTAGYSRTAGASGSFAKTFTEYGYVIGVCGIRAMQTYQQGVKKMWSRRSRFDVFNPALEEIGEQPVFNKEIYAYGIDQDEVFGYQEAFANYKYGMNHVSGAVRSNWETAPGVPGSLDFWSYAIDFDSTPRLSSGFIAEDPAGIERTIATDDPTAPQYIIDWYFDVDAYRPMKVHPMPAILGGRQ